MMLVAFLFFRLFFPELANTYKGKLFTLNYEFDADWRCTKINDGIALYERWVKENDTLMVRERKGEMVINCSYAEVVQYLSQYQTLTEWMSNVALVEQRSNATDSGTMVYIVFGLPWPFENRDLVGLFNVFHLNDMNCVVRMNSVPNEIKLHPDRERINNYKASWNILRLDEKRTKIVLHTFSDEPPLVPLWVQDPVVRKVFYSNLLRLKNKLCEL